MRLLISFIITIIIVITIAFTGYTFYENIELKKIIKEKNKDIENLDYDNQLLKQKIQNKKNLIKRYQNENKRLFNEIRDLKNNYSKNSRDIIIKPTNQSTYYIKNKPTKNYQPSKYNYNNKTVKQHKRYIRYSGYEKLISDSKIRRRKDNRFVSNSMIYGIYKYRLMSIIDCGKTKKIYKIVNECRAYAPYSTDIIYFKKTNLNELKYFDPHDHKIECKYNQEHGIMHDCRAKIF